MLDQVFRGVNQGEKEGRPGFGSEVSELSWSFLEAGQEEGWRGEGGDGEREEMGDGRGRYKAQHSFIYPQECLFVSAIFIYYLGGLESAEPNLLSSR